MSSTLDRAATAPTKIDLGKQHSSFSCAVRSAPFTRLRIVSISCTSSDRFQSGISCVGIGQPVASKTCGRRRWHKIERKISFRMHRWRRQMPFDFRRRHRLPSVHNRLDDSGTMFGFQFANSRAAALPCHNCCPLFRQAPPDGAPVSGSSRFAASHPHFARQYTSNIRCSALYSLRSRISASASPTSTNVFCPRSMGLFQFGQPLRLPGMLITIS